MFRIWYLGWGVALCALWGDIFQITAWMVRGGCCVGGGYVVKCRCEDGRQKT